MRPSEDSVYRRDVPHNHVQLAPSLLEGDLRRANRIRHAREVGFNQGPARRDISQDDLLTEIDRCPELPHHLKPQMLSTIAQAALRRHDSTDPRRAFMSARRKSVSGDSEDGVNVATPTRAGVMPTLRAASSRRPTIAAATSRLASGSSTPAPIASTIATRSDART